MASVQQKTSTSTAEEALAVLEKEYAHFELLSSFNAASGATIYKAVHRSTGEPVAIKQIDRAQGSCEKWEERLKFELEAHSTVSAHKCRNICNLIEIIPGEKSTFLVMELCGGSQLFDLVASSPKRRLTEPLAAEITRQLVTGVRAIHDAGFIHRDLKPENILVKLGKTVEVKIVDFGAAKPLIDDEDHELGRCALEASVSGTTVWNATPERSYGEAESSAADVWAVGCILFFLLTGAAPFASLAVDEPEEVVIDRVIDEDVRWPAATNFSTEARELVEWLLDKDVAERPTLLQVQRHKFLEEEPFNPFSG